MIRLHSNTASLVHALQFGQWMLLLGMQASLWNFIQYNVLGGGSSALYGVEPWHFYFVNGALNFNFALVAALSFPAVTALQAMRMMSAPIHGRLVLAIVPLYVWLAAISMLPHKEERFLYVAYPQVCAAARNCTCSEAPSQNSQQSQMA